MSSLTQALQAAKKVIIDGDAVDFPLVDIYDLSKLDETRKAQLKVIAKANAKDASLLPADIYNICMDIDARDFTLNELLGYAITPKGAVQVLELSLIKSGKTRDDARKLILQMETTDVIELANQVILSPRKEDKKPDPNEQATVSDTGTVATASSTSTSTQSGTKPEKKKENLGFGD